MSEGGGFSTGIGSAVQVALRQAAAENDEDAAALWCARLAQFGMVDAGMAHFRPVVEDGDLWLAREGDRARDPRSRLERAAQSTARFELRRSVQEPEDAERWYRRAAKAAHALAMDNLGCLRLEGGDRQGAESWLSVAAEKGHGGVMDLLSGPDEAESLRRMKAGR